jgi:peptide/nickel transport system permease protein
MLRFIVRRLTILVPMLVVMSIVSFLIIQAPPGDYLESYIANLMAQGDEVDLAEIEALKRTYGLDQPMYVQFSKWIWKILHGDFGQSLEFRRPINELLGERLALTLLLSLFTILFTWSMAIPIGIFSAVRRYSIGDYAFTFFSYFGVGIPNFLLALLIMWFVYKWFGLKITGLFSDQYIDVPWTFGRVVDMLKHIWVPMLILGTAGTAGLTRIVRANMLDELNKPYVQTARAKGLAERKLLFKYPTRIALNPFVSTVGWALPRLFSGSTIVANVLGLPTIGPLLLRALMAQDMFLAGSIILILTSLTMIGTLVSDVALAAIDPRIRMGG